MMVFTKINFWRRIIKVCFHVQSVIVEVPSKFAGYVISVYYVSLLYERLYQVSLFQGGEI